MAVAPAPKPERIPAGVPHGGFITHVAVTEQGDAAVTLDNIGGLRLWPTLDGTREPVPLAISGAATLSISHTGSELLVGVLDVAGAVRLLRFSRTGVLHGNVQVPGEVAIDQLVAIDGGVLVARGDESIERYDAFGRLQGRIAAEPGEAFGALATRHGSAGVILAERHLEPQPVVPVLEQEIPDRPRKPRRATALINRDRAAAMRWIVLADHGLRWGASVRLPEKLDSGALAIAPSHTRIAVISNDNELVVLDVTKAAVRVDGPKAAGTPASSAIGFVDDDRVVRLSGSTHWWIATHAPKDGKPADPWRIDTAISDEGINGDGAAADGVVVAGTGPGLELQDGHTTKFLGWRQLASGAVITAGAHVGIETTMAHVIWLDRALQRESEIDLADHGFSPNERSWWLDPNHAVIQATGEKPALSLVDFRHRDRRVALGSYTYVQRVDFEESSRSLAIVDDGVVRRFALDLERDQATELQALDLPFQSSMLVQLDPARTGGVVAVAWGYDDDGERIATYRDGTAKPGKHLKAKNRRVSSSYLGFAADGTLYMHDDQSVLALRDGKTVLRFPKNELADSIVADPTGQHLVGIHASAVTMYDRAGAVLWAQNVWGAQTVSFTADGATLVVRTSGGLIALDPATGTRVAAACGFAFGLMTKTPAVNAFNTPPVCEDLGT